MTRTQIGKSSRAFAWSRIFAPAFLALACHAPETAPSLLEAEPAQGTAQALKWREPLDLSTASGNLTALLKVRGSTDPDQEVVMYFSGKIYSFAAESQLPLTQSNKTLFAFEGYNIARFVKAEDGYQMLSREVLFYQDPATQAILECWNNPLNGRPVSVAQVWNDPVNQAWKLSTWRPVETKEYDGRLVLSTDILLAYPSPLPVAQYPEYSGSDLYQGGELFNFFASRWIVESPWVRAAPAEFSWTRISQYLPWMRMAQTAGNLIYHGRGHKLTGGYVELPKTMRDYVEARHPEYAHAPVSWPAGQRNATSWSTFKGLLESSKYTPACTP
jgi:Protein of unknown function (DUF1838)